MFLLRLSRVIAACAAVSFLAGSLTPAVAQAIEFGLKPYLLPLEFQWSSASGWSVRFAAAEVPTPLGVFNVGLSLDLAKAKVNRPNILLIVLGKRSFVYHLAGRRFILELPNNVRGKSTLEYTGDSIYLNIPSPDPASALTERTSPPADNSEGIRGWFERVFSLPKPQWLEQVNANPVVPGVEMAGIRLGTPESEVYRRLGRPSHGPQPTYFEGKDGRRVNHYSLMYIYEEVFLGVYLHGSDRTVWSLRFWNDGPAKYPWLPRTRQGITVGSHRDAVRKSFGSPRRIRENFTECPQRSNASLMSYKGVTFNVCDSTGQIRWIDLN